MFGLDVDLPSGRSWYYSHRILSSLIGVSVKLLTGDIKLQNNIICESSLLRVLQQ